MSQSCRQESRRLPSVSHGELVCGECERGDERGAKGQYAEVDNAAPACIGPELDACTTGQDEEENRERNVEEDMADNEFVVDQTFRLQWMTKAVECSRAH